MAVTLAIAMDSVVNLLGPVRCLSQSKVNPENSSRIGAAEMLFGLDKYPSAKHAKRIGLH